MTQALLAADEPPAFQLENERGRSPFFLICDHAGRLIPRALGTLGLGPADLDRHIAWDIGAAAVARAMSGILDACLVLQTYSRLVIDCNRPIDSPSSIVAESERTPIPGNQHLSATDAERRAREVFRPYHERIEALLADRELHRMPTHLISVHSFTPIFLALARPWHAAVLYHRDARLAHALRSALQRDPTLAIGDNEPYAVSDETDYAIPRYGEKRGLLHVEIEIRQDLIATPDGQREWAERLSAALDHALGTLRS
jgi:predicted N-formylglutamate amidohydrolase